MNIQIVFAYSKTKNVEGVTEYAFGNKNSLPWGKVSQDMKNFAERTKGTTLLMGAKTFSSLPGLLPGRPHIVITSPGRPLPKTLKGQTADYYIFDKDLPEFLSTGKSGGLANFNSFEYTKNILFHKGYDNLSIIGGKSLIESSIKYANKIVISEIKKKCYVVSDVKIDIESIDPIIQCDYEILERREWFKLDDLTALKETVYERKSK